MLTADQILTKIRDSRHKLATPANQFAVESAITVAIGAGGYAGSPAAAEDRREREANLRKILVWTRVLESHGYKVHAAPIDGSEYQFAAHLESTARRVMSDFTFHALAFRRYIPRERVLAAVHRGLPEPGFGVSVVAESLPAPAPTP